VGLVSPWSIVFVREGTTSWLLPETSTNPIRYFPTQTLVVRVSASSRSALYPFSASYSKLSVRPWPVGDVLTCLLTTPAQLGTEVQAKKLTRSPVIYLPSDSLRKTVALSS
jgi:hypothetical protein